MGLDGGVASRRGASAGFFAEWEEVCLAVAVMGKLDW